MATTLGQDTTEDIPGLTTTRSPFIEAAREHGELYIEQPYELYNAENHEAWRQLFARMGDRWQRYANPRFLQGVETLCLDPSAVPRLEDVNKFMAPRTGFKAKAVSGYVPAYLFFDCLAQARVPDDHHHPRCTGAWTTCPSRTSSTTSPATCRCTPTRRSPTRWYASASAAQTAVQIVTAYQGPGRAGSPHHEHHQGDGAVLLVHSRVRTDARAGRQGLKAYGSGLLCSYGEMQHSIESPKVQRYPIQLEWVINQYFEIDHYQPLLFIVESFEHLFELVGMLEDWMKQGKLDNVSPGEPSLSEVDVRSFIEASE